MTRTTGTTRTTPQHRGEPRTSPVAPGAAAARGRARALARRLDEHSLWAFNPPPHLAARTRRQPVAAERR